MSSVHAGGGKKTPAATVFGAERVALLPRHQEYQSHHGQASRGRHAGRCLTLRSSGAPTAGRQAREAVLFIIHHAGLASYRWRPLSSNVRRQIHMSHKRVDQITVSGEWVRHLRPYGKRAFWKAERRAYGEHALQEAAVGVARYDPAPMPTKIQELIARLEADGWYQVRQKGSHRQYHHASKTGTVTVAGKPSVEVPPGTLNSILKQAGLKK